MNNNFKRARKLNNLTQLAVASELCTTTATISRYESGIMQPDNDTLVKLANLYDCSIDFLLCRTDISSSISSIAMAPSITKREIAMLEKFAKLSPEHQEFVLSNIDFLLSQQQYAASNNMQQRKKKRN